MWLDGRLAGPGLGLRRDLASQILENPNPLPRFLEIAPENWMGIGGKWGHALKAAAERYPILCHGLSLSLGSAEPLDKAFLARLKNFFKEFPVALYSEHLSYTKSGNAHLYELLPIPFRQDAVKHVSQRIREVQDFLEMPLAIENVSYYYSAEPEMSEAEFIGQILEESKCNLLLDVNNVYVNAHNHGYDAKTFISQLPLERVSYIHMAGHEINVDNLIIDSHGSSIIDPVFDLFSWTIQRTRPVPVLLERDFNIPPLNKLIEEMQKLEALMEAAWRANNAA